MRREQTLADRITNSSVWRSVVRHGYPDTQRNQALIIASNVFLHIHPVKIKRYATKVTYTFCLMAEVSVGFTFATRAPSRTALVS